MAYCLKCHRTVTTRRVWGGHAPRDECPECTLDHSLLSTRQIEIISLAAGGLGHAAIAERLHISANTVSATIRNASNVLKAWYGVKSLNVVQLARLAVAERWVPVEYEPQP